MINLEDVPEDEKLYYIFCENCQQYFDRRDITQIYDHIHDSNSLKNIGNSLGINSDEPD